MVLIHRLAGYLVLTETYMMLLNPTLHKCSNAQTIYLKFAKHLPFIYCFITSFD